MEKTWIKFIKACIALFIAMNLCGIGVGLFVQANLGSDTITVLEEGMSKSLNISIGNAASIFNGITLILALIIARKEIGWTTIVYGIFIGSFIDFYNNLMISFNIQELNLLIRFLCILVGQFCIVLTFTLLIQNRSGMNQLDAISIGLERICHIPYKKIRTLFDVVFIVVGYLLGGIIGIGSILSMLTTGYGIDLCLRVMNTNR